MKLEDIANGDQLILPAEQAPVLVIQATWQGTTALVVTYKRLDETLGQTLLFRANEPQIAPANLSAYTFDADTATMRLASEAYRISLAHLIDPYLAVRTSTIDPLPHQILAVYKEMLPRLPLRYVLADDPGAGKTVMAGLLIKEMMARGDVERVLVVCPGSLAEQWQDELYTKFGLKFCILTNQILEAAASGNAFQENDLCIARLDKLARDDAARAKLEHSSWDLVICDEAHKMSASVWAGEVKYTKRYQLGQLLSGLTQNLLLMTATPHNGKPQDFQLFMALIDKDRFEGAAHTKPPKPAPRATPTAADPDPADPTVPHSPSQDQLLLESTALIHDTTEELPLPTQDAHDLMRRLVKEELLRFDGTPLFPERRAYTVNYTLSPQERALYEAVTNYVRQEFNRADTLDGKRKNSVGFALTMLQRRLASSPEAIYLSLKRRRERLQERLRELQTGKPPAYATTHAAATAPQDYDWDDFDEDDLTYQERQDTEDQLADTATAAATIAELEAEIASLKDLERQAAQVRASGQDRKWDELSQLLQDDALMFDAHGGREKLIIFTEHKDTLTYLATKIRNLIGQDAVITIQGGMSRDARREAEARFKQDKDVRIMIATDAAGEGINLQRAHLMINYDLPWNPNRLEQRFGRIHRIGQTEVCHLWNLVAAETREGAVFDRLFTKLNEERKALGGRVFDVLGQMAFDNRPLRELLMDAIRYGNSPEVRERLNQQVDAALDTQELRRLINRYALTADHLITSDVQEIREDMERASARKLEPHFIEDFFLSAMEAPGGRVRAREQGRYEVLSVPYKARAEASRQGHGHLVFRHYERVCFAKDKVEVPGQPVADLICPGNPLLDALVELLLHEHAALLKQGCVFIDEANKTQEPRLLLYLETTIEDGVVTRNGAHQEVSKNVRFVELNQDGSALNAGYAPYLDYANPAPDEKSAALTYARTQAWLTQDVSQRAATFATQHILPAQLQEAQTRRTEAINKAARAIDQRLTQEVRYWDIQAEEARAQERAGKQPKRHNLTATNAQRRADELYARLQARLAQLELQKTLRTKPARVVGGALVVPRAFVDQLLGKPQVTQPAQAADAAARRAIELAAMQAVMATERELGNIPQDVSAQNVGYDIESRIGTPGLNTPQLLRFIEVKGRAAGAPTVTVSKNEVLQATNNPESFILAVVEVDGPTTHTTYIKQPFDGPLGAGAVSCNFSIGQLKAQGQVLLERQHTWQR